MYEHFINILSIKNYCCQMIALYNCIVELCVVINISSSRQQQRVVAIY